MIRKSLNKKIKTINEHREKLEILKAVNERVLLQETEKSIFVFWFFQILKFFVYFSQKCSVYNLSDSIKNKTYVRLQKKVVRV